MSRCDIFLENYVNGYQSGQKIVGHVQCTFTDEKTVKGLVLQFKGTAKTSWSETESHSRRDPVTNTNKTERRTVYYGAEETILNQEINLLPQAEQTIPAGVHSYPFSYVLPSHIPSSFDGSHGKVVYKVKATVRRALLKMDYEAESPINVVGIINLNDNSTLSTPIIQRKEKNIGCCCWKSGPFKLEWNLPYSGFIPGQNVPVIIEIENLSNSSVEMVECKIDQEIIFKDRNVYKQKKSYKRIVKAELGGVGAHGERTYNDIFTVPGTMNPPNFQGCSIMEVHHTLTVEAVMPLCTSDITKTVPITIGHIPLTIARLDNQHIELTPSHNVQQQTPSAPIIPNAPLISTVPNQASAPPPPPNYGATDCDPPPYSAVQNGQSPYNYAYPPEKAQPPYNPGSAPQPPYPTAQPPYPCGPPYPAAPLPYPSPEQPGFGWKLPASGNSEDTESEFDDMVFVEKPRKS